MTNEEFSKEKLQLLGIRDLRRLAFSIGVYRYATYNKEQLIEHISAVVFGKEPPRQSSTKGRPPKASATRKEIFSNIYKKLQDGVVSVDFGFAEVAANETKYESGKLQNQFDSSEASLPNEEFKLSPKINTKIKKGQRALVIGSATKRIEFLQSLAKSIAKDKKTKVYALLLDAKIEDETILKQIPKIKAFTSHFGEDQNNSLLLAEEVLSLAKKDAVDGTDAVILFDGISKMLKPDNLQDPIKKKVLLQSKTFFAQGRKLSDAGSLTIIATIEEKENKRVFKEFSENANIVIQA